jgi:AcrR family transcriptional regulator
MSPATSKDSYHHGDLAKALVAAALAAVEQGGPEAVSLRDLAQSLGVSRAAPYRHFADREDLLAAVAARGFEDLIAAYETALALPGDGRMRLQALNRAYFDFATQRPGLHRLMFASDLLTRATPPAALIAPANKAYHLLWRAVEGAFPDLDAKAVKARTITMLSTLYGFLALKTAGRFQPFMTQPLTEDEIIEAVMRAAVGSDDPET